MLVLPAPDAALLARGAPRLQGTGSTAARPIDADAHTILDSRTVTRERLAGWTAVAVARRHVDEVALAEAPVCHRVRRDRLRYMGCDTGLFTSQHLRSAVVASVRDHLE